MHREGDEVHSETDEARGGSTPHIVRWILVISTLAAIVLLSAIWIFGAATQGDVEEEATATGRIDSAEPNRDTDGILSEDFDEFAPATEADVIEGQETAPARTVPN